MVQEWKYHTLHLTKPISENKLKQMGAESWELTGCLQTTTTKHDGHANMYYEVTKYIYYFKMPKKAPTYGGPR